MEKIFGKETLDLKSFAHEYDFFALVRLIKFFLPEHKLNFYTNSNLIFPAADIEQLEFRDSKAIILMNFMGLSGTTAPLPHYLIEAAFYNNEQSIIFRNFLQILHQRVYELLFLSWERYQIYHLKNQRFFPILQAISGLSLSYLKAPQKEFCYSSILGNLHTCRKSLKIMLENFLKIPISIEDYCLTKNKMALLKLEKKLPHLELGNNILLGSYALSYTKTLILIGPILSPHAKKLLANADIFRRLDFLLKIYFSTRRYQIKFLICHENTSLLRLGLDEILLNGFYCLGQFSQSKTTFISLRQVN